MPDDILTDGALVMLGGYTSEGPSDPRPDDAGEEEASRSGSGFMGAD
jgi:hypothetical protein